MNRRYISPSQVPIRYGGLSIDDDQGSSRFSIDEPISEASINPDGKHALEFNFAEECDVHWDLRVINWDIIYQAEFVPIVKGRYITVISKPRKLTATDRPIISDSFRVSESGKLVLTVHNTNSKKKKLLARVRVVPTHGSTVEDEASLRGWLAQPDESC
ncbi:hypothetical protein KSS87_005799 [Heliosperma pusillum]|nr:hypothetical protein KSS87_005799 [Heliosperma pusillum]